MLLRVAGRDQDPVPKSDAGRIPVGYASRAMLDRQPASRTEPMSPIPTASQASRTVSLSAEAMPCLSSGNADAIAAVDRLMVSHRRAEGSAIRLCRPPVGWDHFEVCSASGMGPPVRQ